MQKNGIRTTAGTQLSDQLLDVMGRRGGCFSCRPAPALRSALVSHLVQTRTCGSLWRPCRAVRIVIGRTSCASDELSVLVANT